MYTPQHYTVYIVYILHIYTIGDLIESRRTSSKAIPNIKNRYGDLQGAGSTRIPVFTCPLSGKTIGGLHPPVHSIGAFTQYNNMMLCVRIIIL